ncbi:MAG: LysR substrate-binding domain-containing protein [Parvibaculum sp.]
MGRAKSTLFDVARLRRFDHFYLALQAAIDGLGFVLGPLPLISDEIKAGRLISPFDVARLEADPYCWFVAKNRMADPLLSDFIDWLDRTARNEAL